MLRLGQRRKYHNIPTAGYDSKAEATYAAQLRLRAQAGEISDLREQVVYEVQPDGCERICLRIDFIFREGGVTVAHDAKGGIDSMTRESVMKMKLLKAKYPEFIVQAVDKYGRVLRTFKSPDIL